MKNYKIYRNSFETELEEESKKTLRRFWRMKNSRRLTIRI
jgi:hypothetical protein